MAQETPDLATQILAGTAQATAEFVPQHMREQRAADAEKNKQAFEFEKQRRAKVDDMVTPEEQTMVYETLGMPTTFVKDKMDRRSWDHIMNNAGPKAIAAKEKAEAEAKLAKEKAAHLGDGKDGKATRASINLEIKGLQVLMDNASSKTLPGYIANMEALLKQLKDVRDDPPAKAESKKTPPVAPPKGSGKLNTLNSKYIPQT